jgi:hypothetical protein
VVSTHLHWKTKIMEDMEVIQHLTANRDACIRRLEQLSGQTDCHQIELLEHCIEDVNLEIEGMIGSNSERDEIRLQIKALSDALCRALIAEENEIRSPHLARAEKLMLELRVLQKHLAEIRDPQSPNARRTHLAYTAVK